MVYSDSRGSWQERIPSAVKLLALTALLSLLVTSGNGGIIPVDSQEVSGLHTLFLSLVLESLPFLLLGSLVSAILEVLVAEQTIARLLPRRTFPGLIAAALLGLLFPLCECGIVLIAGRLARKGVPLHLVTTFMLAVPLVNPVVILSTAMAFPGSSMVYYRISGALLIAVLAGYTIKILLGPSNVLKENPKLECGCCGCVSESEVMEMHKHSAMHSCCDSHLTSRGTLQKARAVLIHTGEEFFSMGSYFMAGAFLASLIQILVPRGIITGVGQGPLTSVVAMMLLAFGLSLCSNADAFVARGFSASFSSGALVAFLIFGAMIDLKNSLMLLGQFRLRYLLTLVVLVTVLTMVYALAINQLGGLV